MPSEIPASQPAPSVAPVSRSQPAEPVNSLRLLESLPQQIITGQQLQAQVITIKEAAQLFHILLKLQMPNGQHANIQAQTAQALPPGQALSLTALSGQHFSFNLPTGQAQPALTQFNPQQFPPGSQIQARVLQVDPQALGNFRITLTLNSGAQAGQHFTVESAKALAVNSLVNAQVNGRFELNLLPAQHRFQQLAVQQELGTQFARQGSPSQVLQQLAHMAGTSANEAAKAPPGQVLTPAAPGVGQAQINLAQLPPGSKIEARVLQVESQAQGQYRISLALTSGQQLAVNSNTPLPVNSLISAQLNNRLELNLLPTPHSMQPTDIQSGAGLPEAGLKTIQQLLGGLPEFGSKLSSSQLAELIKNSGILLESRLHSDQATQQDLKAGLLRLLAQLSPHALQANPLTAGTQAAITSQALPQLLRELGGSAASIREQALRFPVTSRILEKLDNPNDLGALLRLAAAAISRLQTHQLASLAQTYTTAEGTQVTTWQTEIPMRDQHNVVPLQVKFQQEQQSPTAEEEARPPVWRLELSFEIEPLGPLHVQVNLQEDNLSSRLWAEQENTAQLVKKELHVLRDKLLAAGLNIRELDCEQGIPPAAPKALIEQRWIDDLA